MDLENDGVILPVECQHFYTPQLHRMECLGHELVPFADVMCQMMDMLKPEEDGVVSACTVVCGWCCLPADGC